MKFSLCVWLSLYSIELSSGLPTLWKSCFVLVNAYCYIYIDSKVVYRRYASLFFIAGCSSTDNELITLEVVHRYVEQMDKYYGNVCELDIIFNFQKAYFILDELLLAGELQESSKKNVLRCISQQDSLEDMEVSDIFPLPLNSSPLPLPLPLPLPFDALSSHYTLFYSTPGSNGLILPRSRKMWSPRSCSGSLFAFVASILINTTVVHMSGYRRNVSQS